MLSTITLRFVRAAALLLAMNVVLSADLAAFSQHPCGWVPWEERSSDLMDTDKLKYSIDDAFDTRADCIKKAETRGEEVWNGMSKGASSVTTVMQTERGVLLVETSDNGSIKA
jgi:hypothetical protein